jgi:hypothetical protein
MYVAKSIRLLSNVSATAGASHAAWTAIPWNGVPTLLGSSLFVKWTQASGSATLDMQLSPFSEGDDDYYGNTSSSSKIASTTYKFYEQYNIFTARAAPSATGATGEFLSYTTLTNLLKLDRPFGSIRLRLTAITGNITEFYAILCGNVLQP